MKISTPNFAYSLFWFFMYKRLLWLLVLHFVASAEFDMRSRNSADILGQNTASLTFHEHALVPRWLKWILLSISGKVFLVYQLGISYRSIHPELLTCHLCYNSFRLLLGIYLRVIQAGKYYSVECLSYWITVSHLSDLLKSWMTDLWNPFSLIFSWYFLQICVENVFIICYNSS